MEYRKLLGLIIGCLMLCTGQALAEEFNLAERLKPETARLRNGMEIVVIPDHRVPVVTHMMWYRVGSADEKPGHSGIAHFFEHLMFKGTKKMAPGEFSKTVARNGGQDNAFTSYDFTAYFERVALDRLELIMSMEADRMRNLQFPEEVFYPERDVIIEERSQRTDNNPSAQLSEQMSATLYQNHHYGIPVIGWKHEIAGLTYETALDFYKTYYAPNNAILIVAGDVTMDDVLPMAKKYYGRLKKSKLPERVRHLEPEHVAARRIMFADERVKQPAFERQYLVPSASSRNSEDSPAVEVLSHILGEGATSRLYKEIVVKQGLAASASTGYFTSALNETDLSISVLPRPGVSVDQVEAAVDSTLADLLENGVTQEEVDAAAKTMVNNLVFALDSQMYMNYIFGMTLTTGGTIESVLQWPDQISSVTAEDVNRVARKYLVPARSVTGHLLVKEGE